MKTVEVILYDFSELTDEAKEKARDDHRQTWQPVWCEESKDSIEAFISHFGVSLTRYEVDAYSYDYATDMSQSSFRGVKLKDFDREYMPTGYCLDADLWQTFYDKFKATGCARIAFNAALDAAFDSWSKDLEYQQSDEYIDDFLEANQYQFTSDGKFFWE